jgi:Fe-coproporphyrin III synthase
MGIALDADRVGTLVRRASRRLLGDDYQRADGSCRMPPEWLVLVVNNFCNLHCRMCDVGLKETSSVFYSHLVGDDPQNMSLELLSQILDQATRFFPRPRVGLAFTEPLVHPGILDLCRAIVGRGFFCSITTNGFLLPRLAEALVEIGVHEITVSVDGPEAVHDQIRGREGSFRNLREGIERVNRAKAAAGRTRPVMRFSYTITDQNYTQMLNFVREIEGLHPASLTFSHLNFISDEMARVHNASYGADLPVARANLGTMDLHTIDVEAMTQALLDLKAYASARPGFPRLTIVPDVISPARLETYYRDPLTFIGGRNCTDPWRLVMIKTDGTANPAHGRCFDVPVGNVKQTPLPELWNHGRFRAFRQSLKAAGGTLPACARCCGVIGKPVPAEQVRAN